MRTDKQWRDGKPMNSDDVLLWTIAMDVTGRYRSYIDIGCYTEDGKWIIYYSPEATVFKWCYLPQIEDLPEHFEPTDT